MPSCIVKGCTHYTGMKTSNPLLTMHVFPREIGRIKLWLQQTGQDFGDIDAFATKILDAARSGKYRICSAHFGPGSYTSQGSRIVLKQDAVPTLFPGIYPKPPQDWKPFPPQAKKIHLDLDILGKRDTPLYVNAGTPKQTTQKREVATQTDIGCQKPQQGVPGRTINLEGVREIPTEYPYQEQLLDANGRCAGVFYRTDSGQNELKPKQTQHIYKLSSQIQKECFTADSTAENRIALTSLENILVSLLQHLSEVPLTSRPQKQKTSRLLNQAAEIISILTGEEWTVVKKNAHISKFYQMIREVPIKCGDVAVFFTMDEWDYIEEHEDQYKHVMLENPLESKNMRSNMSSDSSKEEVLESKCDQRLNPIAERLNPIAERLNPIAERLNPIAERLNPIIEQTADTEALVITESHPDPPLIPDTSLPLSTDKCEEIFSKDEDNDAINKQCSTAAVITGESATCLSRRKESSSEECTKWDTVDDSCESPSSELWIAQDGTTSSQWIPQEDPRPPGWSYYSYPRKRSLVQCPVSLSWDTTHTVQLEHSGSDHAESKRAPTVQKHRCELCDTSFPDKHELLVHEKTHTKKQRL
ncbi:uncharacterized protein LOC142095227 [Mixophyes fleayi]|uniref:uncharacterized protein LOC142095227 n=1 Tax=Mixophyes fleayi TaxID=3061075 RepID=UPI003F4DB00C